MFWLPTAGDRNGFSLFLVFLAADTAVLLWERASISGNNMLEEHVIIWNLFLNLFEGPGRRLHSLWRLLKKVLAISCCIDFFFGRHIVPVQLEKRKMRARISPAEMHLVVNKSSIRQYNLARNCVCVLIYFVFLFLGQTWAGSGSASTVGDRRWSRRHL